MATSVSLISLKSSGSVGTEENNGNPLWDVVPLRQLLSLNTAEQQRGLIRAPGLSS